MKVDGTISTNIDAPSDSPLHSQSALDVMQTVFPKNVLDALLNGTPYSRILSQDVFEENVL